MATMEAVRIHAFGGPDVLKIEEAPRPEPKDGEVLIKVHAAGVNPVDWRIRKATPTTSFRSCRDGTSPVSSRRMGDSGKVKPVVERRARRKS